MDDICQLGESTKFALRIMCILNLYQVLTEDFCVDVSHLLHICAPGASYIDSSWLVCPTYTAGQPWESGGLPVQYVSLYSFLCLNYNYVLLFNVLFLSLSP